MTGGAGVAVLFGLWWLAWTAAATLVSSRMDGWIAAEAAAGRQWTCPNRLVEGFPGAIRVQCERPTFRGEVAGHMASGSMEGMTAGLSLDRPGTLVAELRGPLNLRAEDDAFLAEVSWHDLAFTIPGVLGGPTGGGLTSERFAFTLAIPEQGVLNVRTAQLSGEAATTATPTDVGFSFVAKGVTFPTADPVPGLDAPADAKGQGVLVGGTLLAAPTVARLEAWRQAGGHLTLSRLELRKGSFAAAGDGTLALDQEHRPVGSLKTAVSGFEPIAERLGIPAAGVKLGGLIGNLLGGGKSAPGQIPLPLSLSDGRLSVGPVVTGVHLAPLY